jgi:hypothetical protein
MTKSSDSSRSKDNGDELLFIAIIFNIRGTFIYRLIRVEYVHHEG